jgi:uncharacterized protein (TIGR02246 family)
MKINLFYSLMAACLLMLAACQQTPETPVATATVEAPAPPDMAAIKAEIQAIENDWAKASNARDVATIVAFYADDAVSMADDMPMAVGKAAILKLVEAEMEAKKEGRSVSFETLDVFGDDKMLTEIGKSTVVDATGNVTYTGKYMALWEKRDGKWLTIRDMTNDDAKAK